MRRNASITRDTWLLANMYENGSIKEDDTPLSTEYYTPDNTYHIKMYSKVSNNHFQDVPNVKQYVLDFKNLLGNQVLSLSIPMFQMGAVIDNIDVIISNQIPSVYIYIPPSDDNLTKVIGIMKIDSYLSNISDLKEVAIYDYNSVTEQMTKRLSFQCGDIGLYDFQDALMYISIFDWIHLSSDNIEDMSYYYL